MKRTAVLMLCFMMLFCLSGCRVSPDYREPDSRYLVSAIGFDGTDGLIRVTMEIVTVSESEKMYPQLFSDTGKTVKEGINNLSALLAKTPNLSHCGIVILGDTLTEKQFTDCLSYCADEGEITPAVRLIAAKDSLSLLRCRGISSPIVGHDLLGVLRQNDENGGFGKHDRLYEIETLYHQPQQVFALPYFTVKIKGTEGYCNYAGLSLFKNEKTVLRLGSTDSALYAILIGVYRGGSLTLDGHLWQIAKTSALTDFSYDGQLKVTLKITIRQTLKESTKKELQNALNAFLQRSRSYGDIFAISNAVAAKDPALWAEIKDDYDRIFDESIIKAEYSIKEEV